MSGGLALSPGPAFATWRAGGGRGAAAAAGEVPSTSQVLSISQVPYFQRDGCRRAFPNRPFPRWPAPRWLAPRSARSAGSPGKAKRSERSRIGEAPRLAVRRDRSAREHDPRAELRDLGPTAAPRAGAPRTARNGRTGSTASFHGPDPGTAGRIRHGTESAPETNPRAARTRPPIGSPSPDGS